MLKVVARNRLSLLCAALFLCSGTGCSVIRSVARTDGGEKKVQPQTPLQPKPPLKLEVAQSFVAEGRLHVKAIVEALGEVDSEAVVVSFRGLSEGKVLRSESRSLEKVLGKREFVTGQRAAVWFEAEAGGLTEYQVSCAWGKEGEGLLAEKAAPIKSGGELGTASKSSPRGEAALERVTVSRSPLQCNEPPCDEMILLSAEVVNGGGVPLVDPKLLVSLVWVEEGKKVEASSLESSAPQGENEEALPLLGITVLPGERKPFRVRLEEPLPVFPGGRFEPQVRLLP